MNRISKLAQAALVLIAIVALSGCSLGQAAATPTAAPVDVNAIMTSAAATAFVQLTQIAGQASATSAPSKTPTPAPPTNTPGGPTGTPDPGLQLVTATEAAGGIPAATTPLATGAAALTPGAGPSLTPLAPIGAPKTALVTCLNSQFAGDITIPDGTVMTPGQKFQKIWAIKNTGTCAWDDGFGMVLSAGPAMGGSPIYFSTHDQAVQPGGTVDMAIEMRAPYQTGEYIAHWIMVDDKGNVFGPDVTVVIKVQ